MASPLSPRCGRRSVAKPLEDEDLDPRVRSRTRAMLDALSADPDSAGTSKRWAREAARAAPALSGVPVLQLLFGLIEVKTKQNLGL